MKKFEKPAIELFYVFSEAITVAISDEQIGGDMGTTSDNFIPLE